jgi:putative spermidine/putrescine transport system ATP-binding protein
VVFQNYALFPHMTIFDNVAFSLKMRNLQREEIRRRVAETLELVRLTGFESRFPQQLSGGQQQRTALARAIVFKPSILLLDEPLGALDRMLREHMQLELRRMHQQLGTTMIYVTHDQDEALVLSDRVVVMNKGVIEQVGAPEEIYDLPQTRFVAEFIGETNFVEASVIACSDSSTRVESRGVSFDVETSSCASSGERVNITLRPECIDIRPAAQEQGMLDGIIEDRIYLGDVIKYRVRVGAELSMIAKVQARRSATRPLELGNRVSLTWKPADARVVSARSPAA